MQRVWEVPGEACPREVEEVVAHLLILGREFTSVLDFRLGNELVGVEMRNRREVPVNHMGLGGIDLISRAI